MKRIEQWGTELAMAIRQRSDAQAACLAAEGRLDELEQAILNLQNRILSATTEDLYVGTGEFPAVSPAETAQFSMEDRPCPGPQFCSWSGRRHMHALDGAIYDVNFTS